MSRIKNKLRVVSASLFLLFWLLSFAGCALISAAVPCGDREPSPKKAIPPPGSGGNMHVEGVWIDVVAFNQKVTNVGLTTDLRAVRDFVNKQRNDTEHADGTALCAAVSRAVEELTKFDKAELDDAFIITFTDGDDNFSSAVYKRASPIYQHDVYKTAENDLKPKIGKKPHEVGIEAYAIGYGAEIQRKTELERLVTKGIDGKPNYFEATNKSQLSANFNEIEERIEISIKHIMLEVQEVLWTDAKPRYFKISIGDESVICKWANNVLTIPNKLTPANTGLKENPNLQFFNTPEANIPSTRPGKILIPLTRVKYIDPKTKKEKDFKWTDLKVEVAERLLPPGDPAWRVDREEGAPMLNVSKNIAVIIVLDCTSSLDRGTFAEVKKDVLELIDKLSKTKSKRF